MEAPDDALMGEVGDGFKVAMSALDNGRYSVAAGCLGIAQGSLEASVAYAKERHTFGKPIAAHQLVQDMIARMVVDIEASRLLLYRAGELKNAGKPNTRETSIAKYYCSEAALRCANDAIQVHGAWATATSIRGALHARRPRSDDLRGNQPDSKTHHRRGMKPESARFHR